MYCTGMHGEDSARVNKVTSYKVEMQPEFKGRSQKIVGPLIFLYIKLSYWTIGATEYVVT